MFPLGISYSPLLRVAGSHVNRSDQPILLLSPLQSTTPDRLMDQPLCVLLPESRRRTSVMGFPRAERTWALEDPGLPHQNLGLSSQLRPSAKCTCRQCCPSYNDLCIISIRSAILLQHRLNTWDRGSRWSLKQTQENESRGKGSPRTEINKQMLGCTLWTWCQALD